MNEAAAPRSSLRATAIALLVVAAVAASVRFFDLGAESLWLDEAWSYWFARQSWSYLWFEVPLYEIHPPLFYSLLKLATAIGNSEFTLRLVPAIFGTATCVVTFVVCRIALPGRSPLLAAIIAGLFISTLPVHIHYSQEVRGYSQLAFAYSILLAGSLWLARNVHLAGLPLFRSGRSDAAGEDFRHARLAWLAVAFGGALCLWTNNTAAIMLAACGLPLAGTILHAVWRDEAPPRAIYNGLGIAILVFVLWSPWIPYLIHQVGLVPDNFWIQLDRYRFYRTAGDFLTFSYPGYTRRDAIFLYGLLPCSLVLAGFLYLMRRNKPAALLLLSSLALPPVLSLIVSLVSQPIFVSKTLLSIVVPFAVLVGVGVQAAWHFRKPLAVAAIIGLAALTGHGTVTYSMQQERNERWRDVAAFIAESFREGDTILALPNFVELPLQYYLPTEQMTSSIEGLPRPYPLLNDLAENTYRDIDLEPWFRNSRGVWIVARVDPESDRDIGTLRSAERLGTKILEQQMGYLIKVYYFRPHAVPNEDRQ
jgi:mannosyltransferase